MRWVANVAYMEDKVWDFGWESYRKDPKSRQMRGAFHTERTTHLAGLWIVAAISNTSHSNEAGSTTAHEHGSRVKDQDRRQCCHIKHKKFPYRPTRDISLLSGHGGLLFIY
jgi:hypothetical protein